MMSRQGEQCYIPTAACCIDALAAATTAAATAAASSEAIQPDEESPPISHLCVQKECSGSYNARDERLPFRGAHNTRPAHS